MIQLAWLWLRHQPGAALSRWFYERVERKGRRVRKRIPVQPSRTVTVCEFEADRILGHASGSDLGSALPVEIVVIPT
jgi:hypothetical protein